MRKWLDEFLRKSESRGIFRITKSINLLKFGMGLGYVVNRDIFVHSLFIEKVHCMKYERNVATNNIFYFFILFFYNEYKYFFKLK